MRSSKRSTPKWSTTTRLPPRHRPRHQPRSVQALAAVPSRMGLIDPRHRRNRTASTTSVTFASAALVSLWTFLYASLECVLVQCMYNTLAVVMRFLSISLWVTHALYLCLESEPIHSRVLPSFSILQCLVPISERKWSAVVCYDTQSNLQ